MDLSDVPESLQDRLGQDATAGLLELLAASEREYTASAMNIIGDRFERRLVEETSKLRVEAAHGFAALRQEMTAGFAALRGEIARVDGGLRQEMTAGVAMMREQMAAGNRALRQEMAGQKFDILKWAFLFWVGQFFAVGSPIVVLIRVWRPA